MMLKRPKPSAEKRAEYAEGSVKGKSSFGGMTEYKFLQHIYSQYEDRKSLTNQDRESEAECHRYYSGRNHGQWPLEVVKESREKFLAQVNIIKKNVNTTVGQILRNEWEIGFGTVEAVDDDRLIKLKDAYYSDKELCDWDHEFADFYCNGVIRSAEMMMYVNYEYDPNFGNIGLKSMSPGTVLRDPNWVTNNSKDCKNAYTHRSMTPTEIKEQYPNYSNRLNALIQNMARASDSDQSPFENIRDASPYGNLNDLYNKHYTVIDYHHMEVEIQDHYTVLTDDGITIEAPSDASDEWFEANRADKRTLLKTSTGTNVYYITTFCPSIDMAQAVESKPGLLQLGRLPLFHWSYNRHNGLDHGLVDDLMDVQQIKNEMISLNMSLMKNARRASIIDQGLFEDDANLDQIRNEWKKPDGVVFSRVDATRELPNAIQNAPASNYNGQEMSFLQLVDGQIQQITPATNALSGEGGQERSAVHFDLKREQSEVSLTMLQHSIKLFQAELGEGYVYGAQSLYSGMERKFRNQEGKDVVIGENELTGLPRAKIIVKESPTAISRKTSDRMLAQSIRNTSTDPTVMSILDEIMIRSFESISNEDKEEMVSSISLGRELDMNSKALQNEQINLQMIQTQQAQQQVMNPQEPMPMEGDMPPMEQQ